MYEIQDRVHYLPVILDHDALPMGKSEVKAEAIDKGVLLECKGLDYFINLELALGKKVDQNFCADN